MIALIAWWACATGEPRPAGGEPSPSTSPSDTAPPGSTPGPIDVPEPEPLDSGLVDDDAPPFSHPSLWAEVPVAGSPDHGHLPQREASPVAAGALAFAEVGVEAGLTEAISGGNSHGVGVGFFDVDGDGWPDIVHANGLSNGGGTAYPSSLWRNNRDGTFTDVSGPSGFRAALRGFDAYSVASADFDHDGDVDIYVTAHPHDVLLVNQGDGTFVDGTAAAGAGGPRSVPASNGSSKIGAWGDLDGDGWLDIAVASSQFVAQPAHGYVLRNNGDGTFTDVTAMARMQISRAGNPCAVMWSDFDNDGDHDLAVWNDRGDRSSNRTLLRNDGGRFTDVTEEVFWTNPMGNPMGIDAADINRDGWLDYYVGNIGGNALLMNLGDGTFADYAASAGVSASYSWGLAFEDLDHDGWWDLFVTEEDDRPYLSFQNLRTNPPTFLGAPWPHARVGNGHNVAAGFADFDHDGDVDVITAPTSGARLSLMRNDSPKGTNHWLEVVIGEEPVTGAFGGVGARVMVVTPDGVALWRDITGGSSRASQNAHSARFGLGDWDGVSLVVALWPDGRSLAARNVPGDQVLTLRP